LAAAAVKISEIEKTFYPDPERAAFYEKKMAVYKNIYPAIAKLLSIEYGF
jgi:sugar (pentulose or hexulose) kinase